jgi:hypothetical protein
VRGRINWRKWRRPAKAVTGLQPYHLKVLGANSAAGLSVVSFEATERLGEPYSVKIRLTHPMDLDRMEYVRRDATFSINPATAPSLGNSPAASSAFQKPVRPATSAPMKWSCARRSPC